MARDRGSPSELEQIIAEQVQEWSANSNEALTVSLWQGDKEIESFNPEFTYPIYGEEEAIFGYQDLEISLSFAAHNLRPHLSSKYKRKFPQQGEIQATDVFEPLKEFLPPIAFVESDRGTALADASAPSFEPPGRMIEEFQAGDAAYEVWVSSLADPRAKEILVNMQILVPFFIEGGTILDLEYPWLVERWKIFLLYQVDPSPPASVSKYVFAGYATSFQNFTLPTRGHELESRLNSLPSAEIDSVISSWDSADNKSQSPLTLTSRERISQYILLPSRRKSGLGSRLYGAMYRHLTAPSHVVELTVEDPNEAFDDMRDVADMVHLRTNNPTFTSLRLPTTIPSSDLAPTQLIPVDQLVHPANKVKLAKDTKIQPRQLSRLIEMHLLSTIPRSNRSTSRITRKEKSSNEHDRQYYFWRLLVKERLYQHNRDALAQVDREERVEKVEGAVEALQLDYERLLDRVERVLEKTGAAAAAAAGSDGSANGGQGVVKKKRRRVQIEEEEEDGGAIGEAAEDNNEEVAKVPRKKRARAVVEDDEDDGDDL